jgi:hypothetical protein
MLNNLNISNSLTAVLIKIERQAEIKTKKCLKVQRNKIALQFEK